MKRGYINSLSFPADSVEVALEMLRELRVGMSRLLAEGAITTPIMCSITAGQLPLTPSYQTLATVAREAGHQFRDTILFFLATLDQRMPVHAALSLEDQAEVQPSIVDCITVDFDPEAETVLASCALDNGVLLSMGTSPMWRGAHVEVDILTATATSERRVIISNVSDRETAEVAIDQIRSEREQFIFANWNHLTDGAIRAAQLDEWFVECQRRPGLEQLVMRSVSLAKAANWRPDGELIKKLSGEGGSGPLFEIRAYYAGSNNVRLLFGRNRSGALAFGYGGLKTSPDWYKFAMSQADGFIWPPE